MVAKSGSLLLGAAVAAYMVSKEVYIVDAEFYEMLAIFGAYYIWYLGGRDGAIEYFNERKAVSFSRQSINRSIDPMIDAYD